jgi:hypothetical protein
MKMADDGWTLLKPIPSRSFCKRCGRVPRCGFLWFKQVKSFDAPIAVKQA